jgi:Domain of unknown function (DUF4124)
MNRLAKFAVAGFVIIPVIGFAQSAQTIYKFVDENGRVTYANSPIKGGAKLDLEPLTIIQSSPSSSNAQPPSARNIPVAKVTSVPSPSYSIAAAPHALMTVSTASGAPIAAPEPVTIAPPPTIIAALDNNEKIQQRRAEVRLRILQSEIQVEEKSLGEARAALAEEQRRSGEIRTMRASFSTTAQTATAQKPLISPEVRTEIERHFERVRNLQDQVAMHEGNIGALREEMIAKK